MKILLVEATLKGFSRVKDGSVKFSFQTIREMSNDGFSLVDKYYQQNGHLAFKIDEIELADIPTENSSVKGQRSRSQQLRLKLFALHMKQGGTKDDFAPFYDAWMNKFDQQAQDALHELED